MNTRFKHLGRGVGLASLLLISLPNSFAADGHADHTSHQQMSEETGHDTHEDTESEHEGHDSVEQDHSDEDGHEEGHSEEEGHIEVDADRAEAAGITTAKVGSKTITESLLLYGRTEPDPQKVSHVRARYPGLIRRVYPALGERVASGKPILSIESNQSLQRYSVKAPISGTVVQRHANAGEFAGDNELLTIADYSQLWVSLSVFPQDAERIRAGQVVRLRASARAATSEISFINPGTGERPSIMARLPLNNSDGQWSPGLLVEGEVIVAEQAVPLAIANEALQTVEGESVVFRQTDDGFEVTPVTLGRRDARHSEVLAGLQAGQIIAVQNSYLLKAELEKSGASHDH